MPMLLLLMPILLLLMQILDSDQDLPAFDAYFNAYYTDFAASDADVTAYDGEFAVFVLHLLLKKVSLLQFSIPLLLMPARYHKTGAGRVPLCGLNKFCSRLRGPYRR